MQVLKFFEKSLNCVKKRKVFKINSLVSIWLYDFLANKIDWLKSNISAIFLVLETTNPDQ
jgi:hypothetical protein